MAVYDDNGELIGYRFSKEPEKPLVQHLYEIGTHIIFAKSVSNNTPIAVSIA